MKCKRISKIFSLAVWQCLVSFATSKRKDCTIPTPLRAIHLRLSYSLVSLLRCLINCAGQLPNWYSYRFISSLASGWSSWLSMGTEETAVGIHESFVYFFLVLAASIGFIPLPSRLPTRLADCSWLRDSMGILYGSHFNRARKRTIKIPNFICSDRTVLKQHHHLIQTWVCHEY